jgi:hypothetical protein
MAIANITGNILTDTGVAISSLVSGSGTTNYLPKFTGASTLGNSLIFDNGTNTAIGGTTITDGHLLNIIGSSATSNVGIVLNKTNATAQIWGITNVGALTFYDYTAAAERMRITSAGNVGIGTSSPGGQLDVYATGTDLNTYFSQASAGNNNFTRWTRASGPTLIAGVVRNSNDGNQKANTAFMGTTNAYDYLFYTNDLERMRITSAGAICINTTAPIAAGRFNIVDDCNSTTPIEIKDTATSNSGAYMVRFVNSSGVVCGSIAHQSSTTTQYNTSSDYRLKTDLKDYNGLELVSKIKTYDFKWIEDDNRMYGVLAHELYNIMPYAVNGEKDGEQMQGVDYSKLVPILIKSIQELEAKIVTLESKIN